LPTILIVDDYPSIRAAIRARFAPSSELVVCGEAISGLDAIEKARALRPDLVLLDISMPGMNGVEAASILKGLLPAVRIIAFTMYANTLRDSLAATIGIDAVFSKPEGIEQLMDYIRALPQPAS